MHVLEVYGAEGCCDGVTTWRFRVNDGKWLDFTVPNLNRFGKAVVKVNRPPKVKTEEKDVCKGFTNFVEQCDSYKGKHYEKVAKGYAKVDFCPALVKTQRKSCADYCTSQDRVCLFGVKNRNNENRKTKKASCSAAKQVMKSKNKNGCNGNWQYSICGCSLHKISEKPSVKPPKAQAPKVNPETNTTHWDIKPMPL